MTNLTTKDQIEGYLLSKQKQVEEQLKTLEKEDPVFLAGVVPGSSELGDDAWEAEVHAKAVATKNSLLNLSVKIKESLQRLRMGTYGTCEKCGKDIEIERLQAFPAAAVCAVCVALVGSSTLH